MLNLYAVKATGVKPRVHGNGFIQLDLDNRNRLHVWGDPRIPKQEVSTPIHDHVFGFRSEIIVGRLINMVYKFAPNPFGDYRVYESVVRKGEDTVLEGTPEHGRLYVEYSQMMSVDGISRGYDILLGQIHESIAPDGPTATIITKDAPTRAQGASMAPRVFIPIHLRPDNNFRRDSCDEKMLWQIISDVLEEVERP